MTDESSRYYRDKMDKIIAGLQLIREVGAGCCVFPAHDLLTAGDPSAMNDEQTARMRELGWHVTRESGEVTWGFFT